MSVAAPTTSRPQAVRDSIAHRRTRFSVRPFYTGVLLLCTIAVLSLALRGPATDASLGDRSIWQRQFFAGSSPGSFSPGLSKREDESECRLVHRAKDQCAFIKANCPDEEAGLFSYLTLYYCKLAEAKPVTFGIIVLWVSLLFSTIGIAASDFFCINLSTISSMLGMSESMAGVTFLAFGNGSPDVFSTFAAMSTNSGSLAVGELIGAASFITAVVAGSMAIVRPFKVARKSFVRDVGFFIVACSFSIVFLADGVLYLWECVVMVGFYVFYVAIVVLWHWWLGKRRARREREAAARGHYYIPGRDELEVGEENPVDEDTPAGERSSLLGDAPAEDFGALERDQEENVETNFDEDDDEARDKWFAEMNSNMRVNRPRGGRRNTLTPIRPSLVGALEFRAVLSSLQKHRTNQAIPINLRHYSDDPEQDEQDRRSHISDPEATSIANSLLDPSQATRPGPSGPAHRPSHFNGRLRGKSTNDVDAVHYDPSAIQRIVPEIDLLSASPTQIDYTGQTGDGESGPPSKISPSPAISISPPPSQHLTATQPTPERVRSPDYLTPPALDFSFLRGDAQNYNEQGHSGGSSPAISPGTVPHNLRLTIPGKSSPPSPFPPYTDNPSSTQSSRPPSIRLPPPSISTESIFQLDGIHDIPERPVKWWPYRFLPPPQILASALFPTLYGWETKNVWEKFIGVIAAPSVFLLTITLPVVEAEKDEDGPEISTNNIPVRASDSGKRHSRTQSIPFPDLEQSVAPTQSEQRPGVLPGKGLGGHGTVATVAASTEELHHHEGQAAQENGRLQHKTSIETVPTTGKDWNRWLICIQALTAPLFVVVVVWANMDETRNARNLIRPLLISLLASFVVLALLILTTSPSKPPKWRVLLCFLGFAVSITWISTIANEVVGVLKAFGVILNISDAILGLTIFAVGNSLGDLVADITVARLGFPMMALSACFGGPMLNILLGIGVSGMYITLRASAHRHEKHPHRPLKYKPYQIAVSSTLLISAATLLVTLAGLLIMVPWNRWRMDRRIGWALIGVWTLSTVGNLIMEIVGLGGEVDM